MRGNEKEAHLFLTGAAVQPQCPLFLPSLLTYSMHLFLCQSAPSLFRPHFFHLFVSPSNVDSSIFLHLIQSSFHFLALSSCLQGHMQKTCVPSALCVSVNALQSPHRQFAFISVMNYFSFYSLSSNRSSCTSLFCNSIAGPTETYYFAKALAKVKPESMVLTFRLCIITAGDPKPTENWFEDFELIFLPEWVKCS